MLLKDGLPSIRYFIPRALYSVIVLVTLYIHELVFIRYRQNRDGYGKACRSKKMRILQRFGPWNFPELILHSLNAANCQLFGPDFAPCHSRKNLL